MGHKNNLNDEWFWKTLSGGLPFGRGQAFKTQNIPGLKDLEGITASPKGKRIIQRWDLP